MKKAVFFSMFLWMGIMGAMAQGYHYDVNYDDKVTITDATLIVNKILGKANAGEVEGLQEVDLGLPSGTKWASINVGASSPTDIGTYFAWGETTGKINYTEDTYQYLAGGTYQNIYDLTGDLSGTSYDVATALWGKDWCMPTQEQFEELNSNCNTTAVNVDGVLVGLKFTSRTNGNSIILPFTGYKEGGTVSSSTTSTAGYYWSSTPYQSDAAIPYLFLLDFRGRFLYYFTAIPRYQGCPVRAVRAPKTAAPKAIDLGLPSGTKWASFNVGASKPEEYGGYFAWGESEEKWDYLDDGYVFTNPATGDLYTLPSDISGTEYDVAHVKWGGHWCMPTKADFDELVENTNNGWMRLNGIAGYKFTSKINGNSIFLPAAGGSYVEIGLQVGPLSGLYSGICHVRVMGKYWSSTKYDLENNKDLVYYLNLLNPDALYQLTSTGAEYVRTKAFTSPIYGYSVRPVYKE